MRLGSRLLLLNEIAVRFSFAIVHLSLLHREIGK